MFGTVRTLSQKELKVKQ